ncbi:hypothetical protein [Pseudoduganella violacea]|uniref:Putative ATP-grasp superfamily ATP-dependent carboligase n=1 Tax=Pseudoduganella violacea TaxID=1715466 RepID=A0A7W5FTX5_9BURK|nr:hypothetical protein [Pseudoduganella violacea]MBB3119345.1 putative ATP-grasp superfamily ATP-dependent carboligase [Pseudoduganella violacea]
MDANFDFKLDARDSEWSHLKVWQYAHRPGQFSFNSGAAGALASVNLVYDTKQIRAAVHTAGQVEPEVAAASLAEWEPLHAGSRYHPLKVIGWPLFE